jgi:hypothetical protein
MLARVLKALVKGVALGTAGAIALAHPPSAQAQLRFEVAPALGAYVPTRQLPLGPHPYVCVLDANDQCRQLFVNAKRAVAVGGRVTTWLGSHGAIEGSFWYSPSSASGFYFVDFETSGPIVMAGLRVVLSLAPHAPFMSTLLMGGPAVIHNSYKETTSSGGMLGIALDVHPGRRFSVRPAIEGYRYALSGALQQDFVFSLSVSPFGRRGERR